MADWPRRLEGIVVEGVVLDLLMAVMDSPRVWSVAAGSATRGLAWRDAATTAMQASGDYRPYETIVAEAARDVGLGGRAVTALVRQWSRMEPRPDAAALKAVRAPFGFLTNCSKALSELAAARSGLAPRFVLSAEEAGFYKPHPEAYRRAGARLGVPADRTLYVAGSAYDADGAGAAGLRACLVVRHRDGPLPARDVRTLGSLRDVAEILAGRIAT